MLLLLNLQTEIGNTLSKYLQHVQQNFVSNILIQTERTQHLKQRHHSDHSIPSTSPRKMFYAAKTRRMC